MDLYKTINSELENLKYIKTNIFGENNIPKCLENIYENCLDDYNNIKLKNYNLSIVEKNLHLLNEIFKKLHSAEYSGKTFNPVLVKLFALLKGKKIDASFEEMTKNKDIKIDINMSLKGLVVNLNNIINYLDQNEKNMLKESLKKIKGEKCDTYCKNVDCKDKCDKELNRFDILINDIKIYK